MLAFVVVMLLASPSFAWSFKEHIFLTRLAVQQLLADPTTPAEMKTWLQEVCPDAGDRADLRRLMVEEQIGRDPQGLVGLSRWVLVPDQARDMDGDAKVMPFDQPEAPMHYLDAELFKAGNGDKSYRHDLSNKPAFTDVPRTWDGDDRFPQAGYLPYRTEQVYNDLVAAIKAGQLVPGDGITGDLQRRETALPLAAYLAHYLQDNTQPQHATLDYRSASYFAVRHLAPNVHGMFEYGAVDWEGKPFPDLRTKLFDKIIADFDHIQTMKAGAMLAPFRPFDDSLSMTLYSYDLLPHVGRAAQLAAGQKIEDGDPAKPVGPPASTGDDFDVEAFFGYEFEFMGEKQTLLDAKAHQLAMAAERTAVGLRSAWDKAHAN